MCRRARPHQGTLRSLPLTRPARDGGWDGVGTQGVPLKCIDGLRRVEHTAIAKRGYGCGKPPPFRDLL